MPITTRNSAQSATLLKVLETLNATLESRQAARNDSNAAAFTHAPTPTSPPSSVNSTPDEPAKDDTTAPLLTTQDLLDLLPRLPDLANATVPQQHPVQHPSNAMTDSDYIPNTPALFSFDLLEHTFNALSSNIAAATSLDIPTTLLTSAITQSLPLSHLLNSTSHNTLTKTVTLALHSAHVLLLFLTIPDLDPCLVTDNAVDDLVAFIKQHIAKHILPGLSQAAFTPPTLLAKAAGDPTLLSIIPLQPHLTPFIPLTIPLLPLLTSLLSTLPLPDPSLLTLTHTLLHTLPLPPSPQTLPLQLPTLTTLTTIFKRYPRLRTCILEDLFGVLLKLPTGKRGLRTFPVATFTHNATTPPSPDVNCTGDSPPSKPVNVSESREVFIQVATKAVVELVQCCVTHPSGSIGGLGEVRRGGEFVVGQLLARVNKKTVDTTNPFKPVLLNLVDDLLAVQTHPAFPAAVVLLKGIAWSVRDHLMRFKNMEMVLEQSYLTVAFEVLGKITSNFAEHLVALRTSPLHLPLDSAEESFISEGANPSNNSAENTSCICNRPHITNTFMLDCDRCHKWFHGSCVSVRRDSIPDSWFCDECNMLSVVKVQAKCFDAIERQHDQIAKEAEIQAKSTKRQGDKTAVIIPLTAKQRQQLLHEKRDQMEKIVFRQLLLNYLSTQNSEDCRLFMLCKWVEELDATIIPDPDAAKENVSSPAPSPSRSPKKPKLEPPSPANAPVDADLREKIELKNKVTGYQINSLLSQWSEQPADQHLTLSNFSSTKLLQQTNAQSDILSIFPQLLGTVLRLVNDESANLRKPAVKSLNQIISSDPRLMFHKAIKKSVAKCFVDESVSVREAAVTLVGNYVLKSPRVASAYHDSLLDRLTDKGVSVRKAVVKLFKEVLLTQSDYPQRAVTCCRLVKVFADPKEEETIKTVIYDLFMELWFKDSASMNNEIVVAPSTDATTTTSYAPSFLDHFDTPLKGGMGGRRVTPGSAMTDGSEVNASRFSAAALQIIEVVSSMQDTYFLATLVRDLLFSLGGGTGDKDSKKQERLKRKAMAEKNCAAIVAQCADELIMVDEETDSNSLSAIVSTLTVFAQASPKLILPHLDTLLPYLKTNSETAPSQAEMLTCSKICVIMSSVAPILSRTTMLQIASSDLPTDLVNITQRFGPEATDSAIRALSYLASSSHLEQPKNRLKMPLFGVSKMFYTCLYNLYVNAKGDDYSKLSPRHVANLKRSLSVVGSVCAYNDDIYEEDDEESEDIVSPDQLQYKNLSVNIFNILRFFLAKIDAPTKCAALKAMAGCFSGRPKLMLKAQLLGLLEDVMSDIADEELLKTALDCWFAILGVEEKRVDEKGYKSLRDISSPTKKGNMSVSKQVSGDQDSDGCLIGGCLTAHATRFYELCMHTNPELRRSCVMLIGRLLRQGLINPNDCIPYLMCLQGDVGVNGVREEALHLLSVEGEKRPETLRSRVGAGIKLGMTLQKKLGEVYSPVITKNNAVVSVFGSMYAECVRSNKQLRQGLFKSLLCMFVENSHDKLLLNYVGATCAHLPYLTMNEPLFCIFELSHLVAVEGGSLVDKMKGLVGGLEAREEDEVLTVVDDDADWLCESDLKAVFSKDWFLGDSLEKMSSLLDKGDAMVLLLRLKYFLKNVYNISDDKIDEYQSSEPGRAVPIAVPEAIPIFDVLNAMKKDDGPLKKKTGKGYTTGDDKADAVIWRYANFRRLLTEDPADFDIQHAAGKVVIPSKPTAPPTTPKSSTKEKKKMLMRIIRKKTQQEIEEGDSDEDDEISSEEEYEEESDDESIQLNDDDFEDDVPLFQQKQTLIKKLAGGGGGVGSSGKKKRVAGMQSVRNEDEVPLASLKKRRLQ